MAPVIQDAPTGILSAEQLEQKNSPTNIQEYEGLTNVHSPTNLISYTASSVQPRNATVQNLDFTRSSDYNPVNVGITDLAFKVGPESIVSTAALNSNGAPTGLSASASPSSLSSVTGLGTLVDMDEDGYYVGVDKDDNDPSITIELEAQHAPTSIETKTSPAAPSSLTVDQTSPLPNQAVSDILVEALDKDEDTVWDYEDGDDNDPSVGLLEDPLWRRWDNDFPNGPIYGDHNNTTDEWTVHVCDGCGGFNSWGRHWFNIDDYVTNPSAISHYTLVGKNAYGSERIGYSGSSLDYAHAYINGRNLTKASGQSIMGFETLTGMEITAHGYNGTRVAKVFNLGAAAAPSNPNPQFGPLPDLTAFQSGVDLIASVAASGSFTGGVNVYRNWFDNGYQTLDYTGRHVKIPHAWGVDTTNPPSIVTVSGTSQYWYNTNYTQKDDHTYTIPAALSFLSEDEILPLGVPNYAGSKTIKTTTGQFVTSNTHPNDYLDFTQDIGEIWNEDDQSITSHTATFRVSDVVLEDVNFWKDLNDYPERPMITRMKLALIGIDSRSPYGIYDEHSPTSIQVLTNPTSSEAPTNLDYIIHPLYTPTEFFALFPQAVALGMPGRSAELSERGVFSALMWPFDFGAYKGWNNFTTHNGIQTHQSMPHKFWLYNGNPNSNNPTGILYLSSNKTWVGFTLDYNAADGTYAPTSRETNVGYFYQPYENDNAPTPPATYGGFTDNGGSSFLWTPTHYFGDQGNSGFHTAWLDGFGSFDWGWQPAPRNFSP